MTQINKDMLIGELVRLDPGIIAILMSVGMHCVGCPASSGESLAEACEVHGLDADAVETQINEYLANKAQQ